MSPRLPVLLLRCECRLRPPPAVSATAVVDRRGRRRSNVDRRRSNVDGRTRLSVAAKMFVPADGLGGEKPEAKGAAHLKRLFTFVAIRVVQAQIEGIGNDGGFAPQVTGRDGSVQSPDYSDLVFAMENVPLGNGDDWIDTLLKENPRLALRIIEVRSEYCNDFDYDGLKSMTATSITEGNTALMQAHIRMSTGIDDTLPREDAPQ